MQCSLETRFEFDYWKDEFVELIGGSWTRVKEEKQKEQTLFKRMDTMEIDAYVYWVEYQHLKPQGRKQSLEDDDWYRKRRDWITAIRSMNDNPPLQCEEEVIKVEGLFQAY